MRRQSIARVLCGLLIGMVLSATQSGASVSAFTGSFSITLNISGTVTSALQPDSVMISWNTSDNASSQVFYDTTAHGNISGYVFHSEVDSTRVLQHAVTLAGLQGSTVYHFRMKSTANVSGIQFTAVSDDLTFETASIVAETGITQGLSSNTPGVTAVRVSINRIKNPSDNVTATIAGGIGSYTATASGNPGNAVQFMTVYSVSPFNGPGFNAATGIFSVPVVASPIQPDNTTVAEVIPILTGNTTTSVSLTISFQTIGAAGQPGLNVLEEHSNTITLRRGDADKNGVVSVADSLAIKQYLVGQLTISQINPLNAAGPNHDGAGGDKISVVDALAIEQFLVGQRNAYYQ